MYVGCVNHKGMDCEQAYIAPKSWIIKWDENINHCTDKRTFIYSNKLKASKQGTDTRQSAEQLHVHLIHNLSSSCLKK